MAETITPRKPHAVVLASPGLGHLTPFIELVKNLVSHHNFEVTLVVVVSDSSTILSQSLSSTSNKFLHVHVLQPDDDGSLALELDFIKRIVVTMQMAIPHVRSLIHDMKVLPDLIIADMFGVDYWDLADEFGISKYAFFTTSAWLLALTVYLPIVDQDDVGDDQEVEGSISEYISIPGCERVLKSDKMLPLTPDNPRYVGYICAAKRISMSDGIIVNSWPDLEPTAIKSFNDPNLLGRVINGRVYAVGPLVKKVAPSDQNNNQVLKWMDKQPDESVMYVSFGSGGSLTYDQIQELAWGLELSQQRFIWVIRPPPPPSSEKDNASNFFFSIDIGDDESSHGALNYLPNGFLSRTKDVGLVVPMWAPQTEILQHKASGGFLTHCGWNSIIESVINGVPMVAWPLYAEQGLNATMLTKKLNIAVKPEASSSDGGEYDLIGRDEIEKAIRKIMVDKGCHGFKERIMKLKNGAIAAGEADKGSSYKLLSEFSKFCTMKLK